MGQAEGFTVDAVGLFAVVILHQGIGVGVLGIAGVQVALAAVGVLEFQRLQMGEVPVQQGVDVFIDHPLSPGGQAVGVGAYAFGFM